MAKGRKLTTSRSERYLGSYGYGNGHRTVTEAAPELGEEDVWSMVDDMVNLGGDRDDDDDDDDQSMASHGGEWSPRSPAAGMQGPPLRQVGGLSLAFEDAGNGKTTSSPRVVHQFRGGLQDGGVSSRQRRQLAASAPVNVPDWSKIYRVDSVESMHDSDEGGDGDGGGEAEMVPPHEFFMAREHRKRAEHSVFEGVGRTLKGRDLRRVRDAVWSQTGFNG